MTFAKPDGVGKAALEMLPFEYLRDAVDDARDSVEVRDSELSPETRDSIRDLERWVGAAFAAARSLLAQGGIARVRIGGHDLPLETEHIVGLAKSPVARPDMEFLLLEEGAEKTWRAYDRLLSVLPLLLSNRVNRFTENYLSRVAQLHIWGFDSEVHVMCRAALDSALQELLPAERVRAALNRKSDKGDISLGVRVQLARFTRPPLLDDASWPLAWRLKEDGNDALHTDPAHHVYFATTTEAMTALVQVLSNLPTPSDAYEIVRWPSDAEWRPPA